MMNLRRGTVLGHSYFGARPRLRKAVRISVWKLFRPKLLLGAPCANQLRSPLLRRLPSLPPINQSCSLWPVVPLCLFRQL
jgi:hypothetical protein